MNIPFRFKLSQYIYLDLWRLLIVTNIGTGGSIFTRIRGTFKPDFTRYYKRQFLNRKEASSDLFTRFSDILEDYFVSNQLEIHGIPTMEWMAEKLGASHRYMSDGIKSETGKTAIDQLNLFLIEEAKNLLLAPNTTISETAYKLGFEYPQYFSRLFKKKVGISPKEYVESASLN